MVHAEHGAEKGSSPGFQSAHALSSGQSQTKELDKRSAKSRREPLYCARYEVEGMKAHVFAQFEW